MFSIHEPFLRPVSPRPIYRHVCPCIYKSVVCKKKKKKVSPEKKKVLL